MIYLDDSKFIKKIEKSLSDSLSTPFTLEDPYETYTAINRPTFYLKDLGVTARLLAHWKENGLIPKSNIDGLAWNKLTFIEYIWIKIIQELRKFGMALPMIRNVKEYLFSEIKTDLPEITQEDISVFKKQALNQTDLNEEEKKLLIEQLSNPEVIVAMKSFNSFHNRILMMVQFSLIYHKKIGILINSDGEIRDWINTDQSSYDSAYSQTELFISISNFIFEFINDETKEKYLLPLNLMSKEEVEVLRAIRQNDLTEVIITFPVKSGKRKLKIQTKMQMGLTKDEQDKVVESVNLKNYQSITIKNNNGQIYCERIHQKII